MNIEYIIGIILSLIGYIIWSDNKRKSAESLLNNLDTKKALNEADKQISKNEGLEEAELEKRRIIEEELQHNKSEGDSLEDLKNQFNKPPKP